MVKREVWIIMAIGFKAGYIDSGYYYSEGKRLFFRRLLWPEHLMYIGSEQVLCPFTAICIPG